MTEGNEDEEGSALVYWLLQYMIFLSFLQHLHFQGHVSPCGADVPNCAPLANIQGLFCFSALHVSLYYM